MKTIWDKYAEVLVDYSTNVQKGDLVQIRGTSVYTKDLVKAVYKRVLKRGGHPIVRTSIEDLSDTFIKYASDEQLDFVDPITKLEYETVDKFISIGGAMNTKNLAKADELGCSPENTVQLYNQLGIICFDIGRYKDALVNLEKAEQIIGVDLDIMKRKVIIYGMKNDIRNGLLTTNQMKLVAPSDYTGYQLAYKLLCKANRLDAAERELEMAKKYAELSMDYYFDCMTLEIRK